jgi:ABC-type transport system involved in cytochrome c biogenesis permease subunit
MSAQVLLATFVVYLGGIALALLAVAFGSARVRQMTLWMGWGGLCAHTVGLSLRWYEAGLLEVATVERMTEKPLVGLRYLSTLLSHPPFTNTYESLVFFAWALVLVALIALLFFRGRGLWLLLVGAMTIAVLTMGLASLTLEHGIAPLVPALQSWWLHIHVITAFLAYACFFFAALAGVLFLARDPVSARAFGFVGAVMGLLAVLAVSKGVPWPHDNDLSLRLLGQAGYCQKTEDCEGSMPSYQCVGGLCQSFIRCSARMPCPTHHRCEDGLCVLWRIVPVWQLVAVQDYDGKPALAKVPALVPLPNTTALATSVALLLLACVVGCWFWRRQWIEPSILLFLGVIALIAIIAHGFLEVRQLKDSIAGYENLLPPNIDGSVFVGLRSAPYHVGLLLFATMVAACMLAIIFGGFRLRYALPPGELLEKMVYRGIQVGFPLLTLGIVTGSIWANYAWGRPWGWDPKETWSLITWIIYAFYLHARIVHGWKGRRAMLVAIIGFFVVVFTFLGVNLGLTGSGGLHVYGGPFIGG